MKNFFTGGLLVVAFILVACQPFISAQETSTPPMEDSPLLGVWSVDQLAGHPVTDRGSVRIQFDSDGAINGNAGCNRFFGKFTYTDQRLAIEPLGSTRMMCLPSLMDQEQRLLEELPTATQASVENNVLKLRSAAGQLIIQATREPR